MKTSHLAVGLISSASILAVAGAASAQSMDYGALQQVFGEPVTTAATGKPQRISEAPVNMDIITQDDIRRSGADNLPDVLAQVAGIDFRRSSANDPEVAIRGYNQPWNPRLLVLLNGRPVYENFYGDVVWAMIPVQLSEIRQVEIVKGPNSALFGFNAASGVINIVTIDPLHDRQVDVTLQGGTQGLVEGHAVASLPLGQNAGVRISVGREISNEFRRGDLPLENTIGLLHPLAQNGSLDARWQVTPKVELRLEADAAEGQRNFPADETPEHDRTNSVRLGVLADTRFGAIDLDLFRNLWKIDYEGSQAQIASNVDYNAKLSDLVKLNADHTIRISAEYKLDQAQGPFNNGEHISYQIYSLSGMWNWDVNPRLSINNAARIDHMKLHDSGAFLPELGQTASQFNSRSLDGYSFNSGLVYRPQADDTFRLMASRGLQLPSMDDLGQQQFFPSGAYGFEGDPNLKPTAVTNVEADWDHNFRALNTVLRVAVFGQQNQDLFGYLASPGFLIGPNTIYQSVNIGSSREVGGEISLKGVTPQQVRWSASYAYAHIHDKIDPTIAPGAYTSFEATTPRNTVKLSLGRDFGRWELDAHGRWQSKFTDFRFNQGAYGPVAVASYATVDARVGYRLTDNILASMTVQQLNEDRIYQRASTPVERRAIFSLEARY